ncbi:unnamed protein product [Aphis gossypii]|uniref:Uncharacterized protein n=1 Tax=Aphis gossypii TaxID=80765 RepID=A0A9P0NSR1_APHGO|nr:unnamed protein product [Aphis gossypii]
MFVVLPNEDDDCKNYEEMKIQVALNLQECLNNSKLTYQHDDFLVPNIVKDTYSYEDSCKKMKSIYVEGNENSMSYLVRLKAQGYIGIHQTLHEFMYAVRLNEYFIKRYDIVIGTELSRYIIDMDLLHEPSEKQEIQPIEDDSDITNN